MTGPRPLPGDPIAEARRQWEKQGWGRAAAGMEAVTSVMRAQQIYQARVDAALKPLGLSFARYELLMLLHFSSRGSMPMNKAGARLQVHPTSVTNAVGRLETAGLVERQAHPHDGRATLVAITGAGRALALRATDVINAQVFLDPGLDPEQLSQLVGALESLRRASGDFD